MLEIAYRLSMLHVRLLRDDGCLPAAVIYTGLAMALKQNGLRTCCTLIVFPEQNR